MIFKRNLVENNNDRSKLVEKINNSNKTKIVNRLTSTNARKYGIEAAPEYDFTDDGFRFKGFIYKGMPITQCYTGGTCYLSIRVDYLDTAFPYSKWLKTKEDRLCDKYNGVESFDIEEFVNDLEAVIAKVNKLNKEAAK